MLRVLETMDNVQIHVSHFQEALHRATVPLGVGVRRNSDMFSLWQKRFYGFDYGESALMLDKACISTLSFEHVDIKMAFSTFKGRQADCKEALEAGLRANTFNTGQSR